MKTVNFKENKNSIATESTSNQNFRYSIDLNFCKYSE